MKKFLVLSTLSMFTFAGLNFTAEADAKKHKKHSHSKKFKMHKNFNSSKNFIGNNRAVVVKPGVVPLAIYSVPLLTFSPGSFIFSAKSPAEITASKARAKGYKTNIFYAGNRWVLQLFK